MCATDNCSLPQGVIQGQRLDLVLRELTINSSQVRDFDEFPIPFRAIATDLATGEAYVMGEGDLALAIRASMSVPGAFAPVQVDERLLVDGGLVGNLGIEVMQQMGVDVIIAVNVEFPLYSKDELVSALDISEQVLTILVRKETLRQVEELDDDDILIRPDLGVFASTNFADSPELIEPGAIAARAHAAELERHAIDAEAWESYQARRTQQPPRKDSIDFVRVRHDSQVAPGLVERRMRLEPGDPIDTDSFSTEANRLYGLRVFEKVGYQLVEEGDRLGVEFSATSKRWGPGYLRFGLAVEDDFEGGTAFNLAARYWRPGLNALGAEWRTDMQVGTDPAFATEFYQPLRGDSRLFVAPRFEFGQRNFNVFYADERVAELRLTEYEFGVDAGAELGTWGELRLGLYRGNSDARRENRRPRDTGPQHRHRRPAHDTAHRHAGRRAIPALRYPGRIRGGTVAAEPRRRTALRYGRVRRRYGVEPRQEHLRRGTAVRDFARLTQHAAGSLPARRVPALVGPGAGPAHRPVRGARQAGLLSAHR